MTNNNQSVDLIQSPDNALKLIYTACRTCYSEDEPYTIWTNTKQLNGIYLPCKNCLNCHNNITESSTCSELTCLYYLNHEKFPEECNIKQGDIDNQMLKLVSKIIKSGHHSTLEHCQYVFAISGITRKTSHQIVRHRIGNSYSQKSQRYVTYHQPFEYSIPESIKKHEELNSEFIKLMDKIQGFYNKCLKSGILAEDGRDVLPNACHTSMFWSLNLRALIHLANLRLCTNAQHEIRSLVKIMCDLVINQDPWLNEYLVPKCEKNGYCDEIRSCGKVNR